MGIFDWFSRKFSSNSSRQPEPLNGPSSSDMKMVDSFLEGGSGPGGAVIRDFGLQSRNLREALEVLQEAAPTMPGLNLFLDQNGFRSMNRSIRDMNEAARLNLMTRCETVSVINPIGVRGMNIRTDLIVSEGFKVESTAKNQSNKDRVQKILDSHWELNNWESEMFARIQDLGVLGEMFFRLPPMDRKIGSGDDGIQAKNLGMFRCGLALPHMVRRCVLSPWNYEQIDNIYMQEVTYPGMEVITNNENMEMKVIRDERIDADEFGSIRGEVFSTQINKRPGSTRGLSDLACVVDFMDAHDQMFFSNIERAELQKRFIWDVTLENASPRQIEEFMRKVKVGGPPPGSVRAHNQKEIWDAVSPDLKISDNNALQEALFRHVWGGMGLPFPWWTDGGDTNRATFAGGMTDPAMAWARTRKRLVSQRLLMEFRYAVQIAYEAGRLDGVPKEDLGVRVVSRDPDRKGYEGVGSAWKDIADSLNVLSQSHMLDTTSAANIIRVVLGSYGFEIDPKLLDAELKKVDQEKEAAKQQGIALDANGNPLPPGMQPNGMPGVPGMPQNGMPGQPPQVGPDGQPIDPSQQQQQQQQGDGSEYNTVNGGKKPGIMKSKNPLDAIMNESMAWLEKAKREERELKNRW